MRYVYIITNVVFCFVTILTRNSINGLKPCTDGKLFTLQSICTTILKIVVFWFIYIQNNSDPAHSTLKTALKAICDKMFQFYNREACSRRFMCEQKGLRGMLFLPPQKTNLHLLQCERALNFVSPKPKPAGCSF